MDKEGKEPISIVVMLVGLAVVSGLAGWGMCDGLWCRKLVEDPAGIARITSAELFKKQARELENQ